MICDGSSAPISSRDALPGPFDDAVGLERLAVAAAAVGGADFALIVVDGVVDRLRLGPGRGGVVEIDAVWMNSSSRRLYDRICSRFGEIR